MASDYQRFVRDGGDDESNSPSELDFMYDKATIDQAAIFIEDAIMYRSIYHKVDDISLKIYKFYYSKPVQMFVHFIVILIHLLAFFETPSSLTSTWSSDLRNPGVRWKAPCGALESLELFCLLVILVDQVLKAHFIGRQRMMKSKWILAACAICVFSIVDCLVSISLSCGELIRVRRMLRPFFAIQRSTMMKKVWNCLRRTLPEIASVLLLLLAHLYFFTMFGMLLFPTPRLTGNIISPTNTNTNMVQSDSSGGGPSANQSIEDDYFRSFNTSFISLLVLLTTANNPDVMMPAYQKNRFYALYFIVFLVIGLYCLMNMLTAVIYNQFRDYFKASMTSSLFRRRLGIRAAYEMLRNRQVRMERIRISVPIQSDGGIPQQAFKATLPKLRISERSRQLLKSALMVYPEYLSSSQFQQVFDTYDRKRSSQRQPTPIPWLPEGTVAFKLQRVLVHQWFGYFGAVVVLSNVIAISVLFSTQYDESLGSIHSSIHAMNLCYVAYYVVEKLLLMWANGLRKFIESKLELFDCLILTVLVVLQIVFLCLYGPQVFPGKSDVPNPLDDPTEWQLVKSINLLIILRFIRLLPQIKTMSIVLTSMLDIARNLAPFGGLLLALYYLFAILGMQLFAGVITAPNTTSTGVGPGPADSGYGCGTYEQLQYWANNFDDFAASLVVLWNIMVVNNWHIFLQVYSEKVSPWSQLYFILFWILSVIVSVNLFTAIILENFIMRWDRHHSRQRAVRGRAASINSTFSGYHTLSVHEMFRDDIDEPLEEELLAELRSHEHVRFAI